MQTAHALPESLTLARAGAELDAIAIAIGTVDAGQGALTIDASALKVFDTSAIAVLLGARRLAQAAGRPLAVHGVPASMVELSALYGIEELLGLTPPTPAQSART